ncbi:unnamed protein product [Pleuronectes platessa]|uniref:Uncharacterized protein n=1 Tax=Pleuronectes platessa TaxID=8262 RepID=A0A9N7Z3Z3_PLEPL|nr:unnamed protein product [Pleuronectes platessa]
MHQVPLFWKRPEHRELTLPGFLNFTQVCEKPQGTAGLFSCIAEGGPGCSSSNLLFPPNNWRSEVQLPTHLFKETTTHLKLFQTPSSDSMSCREETDSVIHIVNIILQQHSPVTTGINLKFEGS